MCRKLVSLTFVFLFQMIIYKTINKRIKTKTIKTIKSKKKKKMNRSRHNEIDFHSFSSSLFMHDLQIVVLNMFGNCPVVA
jgi:hypothetical protein